MDNNIRDQLADCSYPGSWNLPEQLISASQIENAKLLLEDTSLLKNESPLHYLMAHISLAYGYFVSDDVDNALEILENGDRRFVGLTEQQNWSIIALIPAFSHLQKATKVAFLLRKGDITTASEIASSIRSVAEMDSRNSVALRYGFPALFVRNFDTTDGIRLAVKYLREAIEADPTEPLWYYSRAEFMIELERGERLIDKMPSDEAFLLLEKALELRKTALYLSLAGNLYRQSAKELSRPIRILGNRCQDDDSKIREFNRKSCEFYSESVKLNGKCPETLFRCARGLILLPPLFRNVARAKELIDKGFRVAAYSRFGNQVMAEYYKTTQDFDRAMKHYRLCEEKRLYGATMALIRLEYKLRLPVDFLKRHHELLTKYKNDIDQVQILNELCMCSLYVLRDTRMACGYADRIMAYDQLGDFALQCRPSGAFCSAGFSKATLYDLLIHELNLRLEDCTDEEERKYFVGFRERLVARKLVPSDEQWKEDKQVTFSRSSSNFSFFRSSNDNNWRQKESASPPVLSWRRQSAGPPTVKQKMRGIILEPQVGSVRTLMTKDK